MRSAFFNELFALAAKDSRIVLVTADMGFGLLERFRDELPGQYVNAGISEANAVSLAAGMALYGKKAFVYSIAPFVTYRCLEQIRVDICYQNLDVKIIGMGNGLDYAQSGPTHQPTEDIGMMRSLPNIRVACPADPLEAGALPGVLCKTPSPAYVKLGRGNEPSIHQLPPDMAIGGALPLFEKDGRGKRILMLATGGISYNALAAAKKIADSGRAISLFSVPWIKPFGSDFFGKHARDAGLVVTAEEHNPCGGLWSAACEAAAEAGIRTPIRRISLPDAFQKEVGDREYLRKLNGLDADGMARQVESWAAIQAGMVG